jgi:glutathione synthase/RimK-type ligase-like ATP-grasp enzyme
MKKIGILHGQENAFPQALLQSIHARNEKDIVAEIIRIDKLVQGQPSGYDVIVDRISHDVPFYRAWVKNAAAYGAAVLNNPFWLDTEEKLIANVVAEKLGVPVPKTVLLPSNQHPPDTNANSFRNMIMPLDWESIFKHIGWPAYMKPFSGGGWKNVYKLRNPEELYEKHQETGTLVMLLQEEITFDAYFRCYCIGGNEVHIMPYEPRNPHHERYVADFPHVSHQQLEQIREFVIMLNQALGYDINTVEFALRDGIPYAIDFTNPAPDANPDSVGQHNFDWLLNAVTDMVIRRARSHQPGKNNLNWGTFMRSSVNGKLMEQNAILSENT